MRDYAVDLPIYIEHDLFLSGWSGAKLPFPGQSRKDYAMMCLRNSIVKKFADGAEDTADSKALDLFIAVNKRCEEFTWDPTKLDELDTIALGEARGFIHDFFYPDFDSSGRFRGPLLSHGRIFENFGLGNGSNIGSKSNAFYSKIGTSVMTASSQALLEKFQHLTLSDPYWSNVESFRSLIRGYKVDPCSRLSFVPKTREISRTICTEPLVNMLFQKGIGRTIEQRLAEVCGIDLAKQPDNNRLLAQMGSVDQRFGTIDLKSASDSISLTLVRELLPRAVVEWLELVRTGKAVYPDGREETLHMVSSMGNAFTFPLQTLIFTSLVYGVYRARGLKFERPSDISVGSFAVFGDDIVVLREAYGQVCRLLMFCGFTVNVDKSFNDGYFRESCGSDFYSGYNVRGVYIKTLKNDYDKYSAINRLNDWSARHNVLLPYTVANLLQGLRRLYVPYHESDDAGIKVPRCVALPKIRRDRFTGADKYRCLTITVRSFDMTDVELQPPQIDEWFNNPYALLMAAVAGTLRDGKVCPRMSRKASRLSLRLTPHWELGLGNRHGFPSGGGDNWIVVAALNLSFYED